MNNQKKYCTNCMNEISNGEMFCGKCGHKVGDNAPNQRALKPQTILDGKYLIGKVLGEGGFGITYIARDLTLDLKVAIKEFFPTQFASRNVYENNSNDIVIISGASAELYQKKLNQFVEEGRRLAKLESLPGIVRVLNFFYENNTAYMVMEFIPGQTLKEYKMKNQRIRWKDALDIMNPVIKSLAVLHEKDIIHRDISPDNIMITDEKELVLIDFGTAVELEEGDKSKEIEFKYGYAPPEQYSSHGNQGPWTDVYELCATLYFMITGSTLPSAFAILQNKEKIVPLKQFDNSIPQSVENAILMGLNADIKNRIKNMNELYDYLYNGRRYIPWKKVILGSVIAVSALAASVLVVIAVIIGLGISRNLKENNTQASGSVAEISVSSKSEKEETEADTKKEETKVDNKTEAEKEETTETSKKEDPDTAAKYIKSNKLSYTNESYFSYSDNGNGITITNSDNSLTDIVIPEEINGQRVTAISGIGRNVTSIVLPDTLTSIEKSTFKNCVYLESVFIPGNVDKIGDSAFENCISLSNITISKDNSTFELIDGKITDKNGNKYN